MIRINLLPEEYRKKSRTPIKMLAAISALVAFNAGLLSWWGWTVFGIHAKVDSEHATLQLEMDGLAPQVAYYQSLETESKQYKSREKTLSSITADRISWTRKMDELIDVANAGGDGSRHLVWLDDLTVTQTADAASKNFGSVHAGGHSGSDKFAQVANFLEDLETSAFIDDFERPAPPEGTQTLVDETLVPPIAWAFPMSLSLKGPDERIKSEAARLAKNYKDAAKDSSEKPANDSTEKTEKTEKTDAGAGKEKSRPAPDGANPENGKTRRGNAAPSENGKSKGAPEAAPRSLPADTKTQLDSPTGPNSAREPGTSGGSDGSSRPNTGKPGSEERR
jgi:Tfp pilus assembly protein PilN